MAKLKRPDNRLYLGKGGSGKSTLARFHLRLFKRVLVFDVAGEDENTAGAVVVETKDDLIARLQIAGAGPVRLCWRGFMAYGDDAFEFANRAAWAAENMVVFWEEIDTFTHAGSLPHWGYRLVHQGRHRGCRTFAVARAPAMVARNLTRNVTRICAFRTTEPRDLRYLADVMGQAVKALPGLLDFHCLDWTEAGVRGKKSPFR